MSATTATPRCLVLEGGKCIPYKSERIISPLSHAHNEQHFTHYRKSRHTIRGRGARSRQAADQSRRPASGLPIDRLHGTPSSLPFRMCDMRTRPGGRDHGHCGGFCALVPWERTTRACVCYSTRYTANPGALWRGAFPWSRPWRTGRISRGSRGVDSIDV